MTDAKAKSLLRVLEGEHEIVSRQIDNLQQFWNEVNELGQGPKYEEMGTRIRELRDVLAKHFAKEERGGYLAPAANQLPQTDPQLELLQRQHGEFLDTLDGYIGRLQACESAYHCWQEVREDFDEFLRRLHEHEAAEMAIVEDAIED